MSATQSLTFDGNIVLAMLMAQSPSPPAPTIRTTPSPEIVIDYSFIQYYNLAFGIP